MRKEETMEAAFDRGRRLQDEIMDLRHYRCEQDCRYTMGNVADIGGRHCPLGKPCERCKNEKEKNYPQGF